jgi:hypothetical protein
MGLEPDGFRLVPKKGGDAMVSEYWQDDYCVQKVVKTPDAGKNSIEALVDGSWQSFPLVDFPPAFWEWNKSGRREYISIIQEMQEHGRGNSRKLQLSGPHNGVVASYGAARSDSGFALNNAIKGMGFLPKAALLPDLIGRLQDSLDAPVMHKLEVLDSMYRDAMDIFEADRMVSLELYAKPGYETQTFINQMLNPISVIVWMDIPTFKVKSIVRLLHPDDPGLSEYEQQVTHYVNLIHSYFHGKFPRDYIASVYYNVEIYNSSPGSTEGRGSRI